MEANSSRLLLRKTERESEASSQGKRQEARAGEGCEASAEAGKQGFYRLATQGREGVRE